MYLVDSDLYQNYGFFFLSYILNVMIY